MLQPLSHPLRHPPYQIKDQEDAIRPWLAWSVPSPTHSAIGAASYDEVPWEKVIRGDFGRGDAEVDGSILAAKNIDNCYSMFDRLDSNVPGEASYNGMFLGAEKIWVGEPIRLRGTETAIAVMVLHRIVERASQVPSGNFVTLIGDIYKFVERPNPYKSRSEWPAPNLPPRMAADLRFRNEVAANAKVPTFYEWQLTEPLARRGLQDVKGRWYETRTLLPILRGVEVFKQDLARGEASDVGYWMNGRGDSSEGIGQRKPNRRETFGLAVPTNFQVSRGADGTDAQNAFPDEQGVSDGAMDHFMNLDPGTAQDGSYGSARQQ